MLYKHTITEFAFSQIHSKAPFREGDLAEAGVGNPPTRGGVLPRSGGVAMRYA